MSNIDPDEICENCKHFTEEESDGECRKYAPQPRGRGAWSHVRKGQWCSEFEENPPDGKPIEQDRTE